MESFEMESSEMESSEMKSSERESFERESSERESSLLYKSYENVQLEDLIAFYPSIAKPQIQKDISSKKEFNELGSDPTERLRKARGDYFKHQKFVQRFMQHYDQILLFHETGTGKSCALTAIAEMSKKLHLMGKSNIDHTYIIVNNKTLTDRIQREIVCKCTENVYDIVKTSSLTKRGATEYETKRNLGKWYTVVTRQTFAKTLSNMSNRDIIRKFSNKIFFIDEAHNLIFEPFKGEIPDETFSMRKQKLKTFKVDALRRLAKESKTPISSKKSELIESLFNNTNLTNEKIDEALEDDTYGKLKTKKKIKPKENKEEQYIQYWRLFHLIKNSKTILATATPMLNESDEILDLINLLLPSKLPSSLDLIPDREDFKSGKINIESLRNLLYIPPDEKLSNWSDKKLEKIFRGKISYVRRLDTGVDVVYEGIPIYELSNYPHQTDYDTETKVYPERMGEFQSEIYIEAVKGKEGLRTKERWVSDFVYPDGSYGTVGREKYLEKGKDKYYIKTSKSGRGRFEEGVKFKKDLRKPLDDPEGIYKYSVKFANILSLIDSIEGNVFVYSNLVDAGGTAPFSVCLDNQGYELFDANYSIFRSSSTTSLSEYCKSGQGKKYIPDSFKKKKRYFYLRSGISDQKLDTALELMNSPENVHGEYIKVFMTSGIGGEGISLSNVIQIHLIDGEWKRATNYQAESRAIRATSHNELLKISPGGIEVKIYNHASYTCIPSESFSGRKKSKGKERIKESYSVNNPHGNLCNPDETLLSVDIRMYELSEQKDREIKRMERLLKRVAVDCQVHFQRNTRQNSLKIRNKDYTAECDYDTCVYKCWDPIPLKTDYTTYDVYYIEEPVLAIISILREYFKIHFSVTLEEIVNLIKYSDEKYPYLLLNIPPKLKYVQYAAEKILDNRIEFLNRYGQVSYIQKDGDVLFLSLDYPVENPEDDQNIESDVVNYTADLIGISENTLKDVISTQEELQAEIKEENLELYSINSPEFQKVFYSINIDKLSDLLEDSIIRKIIKKPDYLSKNILKRTSPNTRIKEIEGYGIIYPYVGSWYKIKEPVWFLSRVQERLDILSGKKDKRTAGRRPKKGKRKPDSIKYDPSEIIDFKTGRGPEEYNWSGGSENVYFHTLYSLKPGKNSYDYIPKFNNISGKIRIYKPSEGEWRDATSIEQIVYSLWAQKALHEFKIPYEKEENDIYGFLVSSVEPDFRVVPKYEEREMQKLREAGVRKDNNKKIAKNKGKSTGRRCIDYSVSELLRIISLMGLTPPHSISNEPFVRKEIIENIQKNGKLKAIKPEDTDNFIENVWNWIIYLKGTSKEKRVLCEIIQTKLREQKLIYQTY